MKNNIDFIQNLLDITAERILSLQNAGKQIAQLLQYSMESSTPHLNDRNLDAVDLALYEVASMAYNSSSLIGAQINFESILEKINKNKKITKI